MAVGSMPQSVRSHYTSLSTLWPQARDEPVARPWPLLATVSSHLILLGILALPPLFSNSSEIRPSKTLLTVLALAALTAGLSLTPLLLFAVRSSYFRLCHVLLPALSSCIVGLVALIYYTGVYRIATFPGPASVVSISCVSAGILIYGALAFIVYRRLLLERARAANEAKQNSPNSGSTALHSRFSSTSYPVSVSGRNHNHSVSNVSGQSLLPDHTWSGSGTYQPPQRNPTNHSTQVHYTRRYSISSPPPVHSDPPSPGITNPHQPPGDIYGAGEAPVIKVAGTPPGVEDEAVRIQMARLLSAGQERRGGESTFQLEIPRKYYEQDLARRNNTFRVDMPKAFQDETDSIHRAATHAGSGFRESNAKGLMSSQIKILGAIDGESSESEGDGGRGGVSQGMLRPRGRLRSDEEELYRLSLQRTPVEMMRRGNSAAPFDDEHQIQDDVDAINPVRKDERTRPVSREDRRREIENAGYRKA